MRLKHPNMRPAGAPVRLRFDGAEIEALTGETIAAALAAADIVAVRQARSGAPRGPFCGMGVCFDCLVTVDGRPNQRACLTKVADGMDVRSAPIADAVGRCAGCAAEEIACDVLVVGAGPAGLSAARDLALAGANVIVADERLHAGGQFFKPLAPSQPAERRHLDRQFRDGAALHEAALQAGVRILNETTVWAAFSATEVAAIVAGRSTLFRPKRLVLATGAYEQSLPVPGWTLPGVMTVGGAADPGALLPRGAGRAHRDRGQRPACACRPRPSCSTAAPMSWRCWNRRRARASATWREFLQAGWAAPALLVSGLALVVAAEAAAALAPSRDAPAGRRSRAPGRGRRSVDRCRHRGAGLWLLLVERAGPLARLPHHFVLRGSGSMETVTDAEGRTSVPEVFAIGDGARFGGAQAAMARARSPPLPSRAISAWRSPKPRRARRSAGACPALPEGLWRLFEAAPLQAGAIDRWRHRLPLRGGERRAMLREPVKAGHNTPAALKRATRAGMGRCQGRYCAADDRPHLLGRGRASSTCSRPGRRPSRCRSARSRIEQPEWTGHADFVPPDMARPRETQTLPVETVDTLVIGGGVAGSCAGLLAGARGHRGDGRRARRHEPAGLRAPMPGSLHVQLLAFDFVAGAPPAGNRAADTLPLGPASIALWQEIQRDTGEDLEIKVTGGLMLGESERDIEFLKGKIALEKSRGIEAELIGANELREMEPSIGEKAIAAEWCPGEGKINPLRGTYAVIARAKELGARFRRGSDVQAIARDGAGWKVTTSRGEIRCGRIVNAAGPWAAQIAALAGVAIPCAPHPCR